MKFGTITQTGLQLSSDISTLPAQHSANIQVDVQTDEDYAGYSATAQIGYPTASGEYATHPVAVLEDVLTIPAECFQLDGIMVISLALTNGSELVVTHPLHLAIVGAPGASIVLPPEDIWQQQVAAFVQSYLSTEGITITATAKTGEPGTEATVENTGTGTNPIFKFTIPRGQPGQNGAAATIQVGNVTTSEAGGEASVTNSGSSTAAVFDFTIPRGQTGPAGAGVPAGGTAGQTIVRTADGSTEWKDFPSAEVELDPDGGLESGENGYGVKLAGNGTRGGIVGTAATADQTEEVGINSSGKLLTRPAAKVTTNKTLAAAGWVASSDFEQYPFQFTIGISGMTANDFAEIVPAPETIEQGILAPICQTAAGGLKVYATEKPTAQMVIDSIVWWRPAAV